MMAVLRASQVVENTEEWEEYMVQEGALIVLPKELLDVGKPVEGEVEATEAEEAEVEEDLEAT